MAAPYLPRIVDPHLDQLATQIPAFLVVGARACGKTTTMSRRAASIVRLDRPADAVAFEADPDLALAQQPEPVLIDEWQVVPHVLAATKRAMEADHRPGRFFVTGSVNAELEQQVWPGTGRLTRVRMYPLTVREAFGRANQGLFVDGLAAAADAGSATAFLAPSATPPDLLGYLDLALQSGFPVPALRLTGAAREAWLNSYLADLLARDIPQAAGTTTRPLDSNRLARYFEAWALNSAAVTDHKTIYEAAGVTRPTAIHYDALLTRLFVVDEIPAWRSNRLGRLTQYPKRLLLDPALMAAQLRLDTQGLLRDRRLLGQLLETFMYAQLRAEVEVSGLRPRMFHLRTREGRREVDAVIELGGNEIIGLEVKADAAPGTSDGGHLAWLRDQYPDRFKIGLVLHTGPRLYPLGDRILAAPMSCLWDF